MNKNKGHQTLFYVDDGKPGHVNQTLGLVCAMADRIPLVYDRVPPMGLIESWKWAKKNSDIDWIVAAGHRTHKTVLYLSWLTGARSVILMKPSLPMRWFDWIIVPEHDHPPKKTGVISSRGPINRLKIQPDLQTVEDAAMILVGGPAKSTGWDEASVIQQIQVLIQSQPDKNWIVANSRRTPDSTSNRLLAMQGQTVQFQAWQSCASNWLQEILPTASQIWVTEDSASMVYEALSTQAQCGVISVPQFKSSRVISGLKTWRDQNDLLDVESWKNGQPWRSGRKPLSEASRCAAELLNQSGML